MTFSPFSAVLGLLVLVPLIAWGGSAIGGDTGLIAGLILGIAISILGSFQSKPEPAAPQYIGKDNAPPPPVPAPHERECPYCAEIIKKKAKVCRYCNRDLDE